MLMHDGINSVPGAKIKDGSCELFSRVFHVLAICNWLFMSQKWASTICNCHIACTGTHGHT